MEQQLQSRCHNQKKKKKEKIEDAVRLKLGSTEVRVSRICMYINIVACIYIKD